MNNFENENVRKEAYGQLEHLMGKAWEYIHDKNAKPGLHYNSATHSYLQKEAWEILFPLDKNEWPENFQNMERHYDPQMIWPHYSTYCYMSDVIAPPLIPYSLLHFGYVMTENRLVPSTFFVVQKMVSYQACPQGMVIDPLALMKNRHPSFYIGCPVEKIDIENWIFNRRKNPFEAFVERKSKERHEKRLHDIYMEAYILQMQHEPGWFPPELITFAEKENLYIPKQEKFMEEDNDDDDWSKREAHSIRGSSLRER